MKLDYTDIKNASRASNVSQRSAHKSKQQPAGKGKLPQPVFEGHFQFPLVYSGQFKFVRIFELE